MFATNLKGQIVFSAPIPSPFSYGQGGSTFPQTIAIADLDDDGDVDFFLCDSANAAIRYYENRGTPTAPAFSQVTLNPFGLQAKPYLHIFFLDVDGDNDLDAFCLIKDTVSMTEKIQYQENTGSSTVPSFSGAVTNPFNLHISGGARFLGFTDIDSDNDQDLFIGSGTDGSLEFFRNVGTGTNPAFAVGQKNTFGYLATRIQAAPVFVDIDQDGSMDMLVAEDRGGIQLFSNTGLPIAPFWGPALAAPFNLQQPPGQTRVGLAQADMDGDGDWDLIVSGTGGTLYYYENITPQPGVLALSFDTDSLRVNEVTAGVITANIFVFNAGSNATSVDVRVGTSSSATAGKDFIFANPTTLTFSPFSTTPIPISLSIIDDFEVEPLEYIVLELTNPTPGVAWGPDSVLVIEIESEDLPGFNFSKPSAVFREEAGTVDIEITLSDPVPFQTTINVVSGAQSTAAFGQDYLLASGSVTFPANSTGPQLLSLALLEDVLVESNEYLVLELRDPPAGTQLGNTRVMTITIQDNDNVGLEEPSPVSGIKVLPNPAQDYIEIRMEHSADILCQLYNLQGNRLWSKGLKGSVNKLNIREVPPGIYWVRLDSQGKRKTVKLLINR